MKSSLFFAFLPLAAACGGSVDASRTLAGPPDLRFSGIPVQVYTPSGATIAVDNGATFHVPCQTTGFRARYRYENAGGSIAGAHTNSSMAAGSAVYPFAQAAMGAGVLRYAWASFGAVNPPNTAVKLAIRLDSAAVVAEASEANNLWVAKVVRDCP
jgi:hypothetical protein